MGVKEVIVTTTMKSRHLVLENNIENMTFLFVCSNISANKGNLVQILNPKACKKDLFVKKELLV